MNKSILNSKFHIAFTIAEVLIVIGIIGIVAEMTIPSLVKDFQKQETITSYQKAYSTLINVVKRSEVDNGTVDTWTFPPTFAANDNIIFFNTYLAPYLNISNKCETSSGCWASGFNGTGYPNPISYILSDGSALRICAMLSGINIVVDINGLNAPNKAGRDIFSFVLVPRAGIYYARGGQSNNIMLSCDKGGGVYPDGYGITGTDFTNSLRKCGLGGNGSYCGIKIILDGYKINDDYPW